MHRSEITLRCCVPCDGDDVPCDRGNDALFPLCGDDVPCVRVRVHVRDAQILPYGDGVPCVHVHDALIPPCGDGVYGDDVPPIAPSARILHLYAHGSCDGRGSRSLLGDDGARAPGYGAHGRDCRDAQNPPCGGHVCCDGGPRCDLCGGGDHGYDHRGDYGVDQESASGASCPSCDGVRGWNCVPCARGVHVLGCDDDRGLWSGDDHGGDLLSDPYDGCCYGDAQSAHGLWSGDAHGWSCGADQVISSYGDDVPSDVRGWTCGDDRVISNYGGDDHGDPCGDDRGYCCGVCQVISKYFEQEISKCCGDDGDDDACDDDQSCDDVPFQTSHDALHHGDELYGDPCSNSIHCLPNSPCAS